MKQTKYIRRFSRNDGVQLPDGRQGNISSQTYENTDIWCLIKLEDGGLVSEFESKLISVPSLNTGKYGGPSRGGAHGGYFGVSGYRRK